MNNAHELLIEALDLLGGEPMPHSKDFFDRVRHEIWRAGGPIGFKEGDRVEIATDVDRFPQEVVIAGSLGTVAAVTADHMAVRLDKEHPGLSEWTNELVWHSGEGSRTGNPWDDLVITQAPR